jgi:hypothetical protein
MTVPMASTKLSRFSRLQIITDRLISSQATAVMERLAVSH